MTDQVDCVVLIYMLEGELSRQIGTRGQTPTPVAKTGTSCPCVRPARQSSDGNAADTAGDPYVTGDHHNSRVHRFTKDGELIQSWGQPVKTTPGDFILPRSPAISPDGTIHVCDRANARVQHFTPDGRYIGMWSGTDGPDDIARDATGNFNLREQALATNMRSACTKAMARRMPAGSPRPCTAWRSMRLPTSTSV